MKHSITFTLVLIFSISNILSQNTLLWLKNNQGIIEDDLGAVIRWENQIEAFGDAIQSNPELGGEQLQETYPGKVNVGFSKDGAFLQLEESSTYFSDHSFTVFYVGKVGDVGTVAGLLGNFKVNDSWDNCSGLRFVRKANGDIAFQYGRPAYKHMVLNNLPENEFFYFGFSLDENGNYSYFDNSSSLLKTGKIDGQILHNTDNHVINLVHQLGGSYTYDHTEVAELKIMDDALSTADFQAVQNRLMSDYPELVKSEFTMDEVLPAERTNLVASADIILSMSQNIDATSSYPKVFINKSETVANGSWTIVDNKMTYSRNEDWPKGALVTVKIDEGLISTDGVPLDIASRSEYNFMVETEYNYGVETVVIDPMATVDFPQEGHKLPLYLVLPEQRDDKIPIHIWVHGGGWSGGTSSASAASYSPHGTYLAKNLGMATLGISYRCKGSSGNFTLAMEDIDAAYQWAIANAETYNFDLSKVFISGGSAGSPLAALAAQRYPSVIGFIGFNGVYDFVNDQGSFGQWNGYGQEDPSAEANSPIFQLRDHPPATILMHGDEDTTIPYTQSKLFADKINAEGGEARTVIYPGEVHAFFNLGKEEYEDVLFEMVNFMLEVLENEDVNSGIGHTNYNKNTDIMVYPNPVKEGGCLDFQLGLYLNANNVNVEIVNITGQRIMNETVLLYQGSGKLCLENSKSAAGTYILKVLGDSFSATQKIVVQQ
ncbi:alpha/beta hydrolase fold domain-containing protein [Saccharicrinis sp. 156]|uniref:alpha/beta hydrolase fold domain-containing protein n=1 Tax=Saccharicrinis sp. 156 TaxID=3417574 RepID=UPI003D32ACA0